ncbi:triadin-like [Belonocnema kinseyi]|uniref:triadin-like n=1 Tax=Belonocnema kinseyi TaxID=2817044 RepID=UPI00143D0248|nr:triadin-like [Belonocnema kinseyi]
MEVKEEEAKICRLCGQSDNFCIDVFSEDGTSRLLHLKIHSKINILIEEDDELPTSVCVKCIGALEFLCDFYSWCHRTQKDLEQQAKRKNSDSDDSQFSADESDKENILPAKSPKRKIKTKITTTEPSKKVCELGGNPESEIPEKTPVNKENNLVSLSAGKEVFNSSAKDVPLSSVKEALVSSEKEISVSLGKENSKSSRKEVIISSGKQSSHSFGKELVVSLTKISPIATNSSISIDKTVPLLTVGTSTPVPSNTSPNKNIPNKKKDSETPVSRLNTDKNQKDKNKRSSDKKTAITPNNERDSEAPVTRQSTDKNQKEETRRSGDNKTVVTPNKKHDSEAPVSRLSTDRNQKEETKRSSDNQTYVIPKKQRDSEAPLTRLSTDKNQKEETRRSRDKTAVTPNKERDSEAPVTRLSTDENQKEETRRSSDKTVVTPNKGKDSEAPVTRLSTDKNQNEEARRSGENKTVVTSNKERDSEPPVTRLSADKNQNEETGRSSDNKTAFTPNKERGSEAPVTRLSTDKSQKEETRRSGENKTTVTPNKERDSEAPVTRLSTDKNQKEETRRSGENKTAVTPLTAWLKGDPMSKKRKRNESPVHDKVEISRLSDSKYSKISELMTNEQKETIENFYRVDMSVVDEIKVANNITIHSRNEIECKICKQKYNRMDKCQVHIWRHLDMTPYFCDACDFSTLTVSNIRCHIRKSHLKIKPYQCHICEKRYTSPTSLEEHINTHTGAKPYHCNLCSFSSSSKQVLSYHNLTHKKQKIIGSQNVHVRYQCPGCQKGFNRHDNMKVHTKRCNVFLSNPALKELLINKVKTKNESLSSTDTAMDTMSVSSIDSTNFAKTNATTGKKIITKIEPSIASENSDDDDDDDESFYLYADDVESQKSAKSLRSCTISDDDEDLITGGEMSVTENILSPDCF